MAAAADLFGFSAGDEHHPALVEAAGKAGRDLSSKKAEPTEEEAQKAFAEHLSSEKF